MATDDDGWKVVLALLVEVEDMNAPAPLRRILGMVNSNGKIFLLQFNIKKYEMMIILLWWERKLGEESIYRWCGKKKSEKEIWRSRRFSFTWNLSQPIAVPLAPNAAATARWCLTCSGDMNHEHPKQLQHLPHCRWLGRISWCHSLSSKNGAKKDTVFMQVNLVATRVWYGNNPSPIYPDDNNNRKRQHQLNYLLFIRRSGGVTVTTPGRAEESIK